MINANSITKRRITMSTKELIKELTERLYYISLDEFKELDKEVQELSKVIESNDLLLT